jgi:hypothetical protein
MVIVSTVTLTRIVTGEYAMRGVVGVAARILSVRMGMYVIQASA